MVEARATLSDLEERLSRDTDKAELAKVSAMLDVYASEVKKAQDVGVAPEAYKILSTYREALEIAATCLPAIWQQCQSK
jgi:hypothetical protein